MSDLLLDRQPLKVKPGHWYTATLEVVGDEALFRLGGHVAWTRLDKLNAKKTKVALTLGNTWHEVRRVRVWEATANPTWAKRRNEVLKRRIPFKPQPHAYKKANAEPADRGSN